MPKRFLNLLKTLIIPESKNIVSQLILDDHYKYILEENKKT